MNTFRWNWIDFREEKNQSFFCKIKVNRQKFAILTVFTLMAKISLKTVSQVDTINNQNENEKINKYWNMLHVTESVFQWNWNGTAIWSEIDVIINCDVIVFFSRMLCNLQSALIYFCECIASIMVFQHGFSIYLSEIRVRMFNILPGNYFMIFHVNRRKIEYTGTFTTI